MQHIFQGFQPGPESRGYLTDTRRHVVTAAFGLPFYARCFLLSRMEGFLLCVVPDELEAERARQALELFRGGRVEIIAQREEVLLYKKAVSPDSCYRTFSALFGMLRGRLSAAVITAAALTRLFPDRGRFEAAALTLRRKEETDLYGLIAKLVKAGYRREAKVTEKGQFSVHGDILDLFPVDADCPVRLEFFGDLVERMANVDPETLKSVGDRDKVEICPATDILLEPSEISAAMERMDREARGLNIPPEAKARIKGVLADVRSQLENGGREISLSYVLPYAPVTGGLAPFLPADTTVALFDPKGITDHLKLLYAEHDARFDNLVKNGEILPGHYGQLRNRLTLFEEFSPFCRTSFCNIAGGEIFRADRILNFKSLPSPRYHSRYDEFTRDAENWTLNGYRVVVLGRDRETCASAAEEIRAQGGHPVYCDDLLPGAPGVYLTPYELPGGFVLHDCKLAVIGTGDLLRSKKTAISRRKNQEVFTAPEVGDYVVHEVHGVGICRGITRLKVRYEKEYLAIEFRDGDMLYVPCDQMDSLARYAGGEGTPKLSKIGGKEFAALKEKVKKSVREMAVDLAALYAERAKAKGYAFSPDTPLQQEFEDAFAFEETPDQLRSIAEIKKDMESDRPMERLLCGDVGYGKTEVALRAAFKAICDGKQVAILAPTTILSQQHFNLCLKRFEGFGVRIGQLNRFCSQKEQKETVKKLAEGRLDLVSGTHRLLSSDVRFFDLGLLIVDEEQRFGVEDKEKIKLLKQNVDVLTLSATPIPRTLHLSMTGIRDISVLETPPRMRLPVQTYVTEYTDSLAVDAIMRELNRGGQAFVLYNRVDSIYAFAHRLAAALPAADIAVAHGQMKEEELEKAILGFYSGEKNVLVCTTIIENGIDIPNANTLLVVDADRLGLSQLYQIKGRVGRSDRLAHVYFTYQQDKVLSESAYKRLNAILEFTELGSGFKIAMRDLEIRGAGSLLGREQHGHMEKVGYDMYVRLLKSAVDEMSGKPVLPEKTEIDLEVDAFIPDTYVPDNSARIKLYQNIAGITALEEAKELNADLRDIYGEVPKCVLNLIKIALMRQLARAHGIEKITLKNTGGEMIFKDMNGISNPKFLDLVTRCQKICALTFSDKPRLVFPLGGRNGQFVFENMYKFLRNL